MEYIKNLYKILKKIKVRKTSGFSGIGLVVYNTEYFDHGRHCDLRPDIKSPKYSVCDDNICDYLIDISHYEHALHDGFHMMSSDGVPPVVKDLKPNPNHGVRLYSSLCGSTIDGVLCIGIISSNYNIYMFKSGEYIDLNKLEEEILSEEQHKYSV